MDGTGLLLAAALSLPSTGWPELEWDGGASPQAVEDAAAMPPAALDTPRTPQTVKPMKPPHVRRVKEGARDPREGRNFRRITGRTMGPVGPICPDGSDPPCQETQVPQGNPPLGGYYYGLYRGADGKLRYGKLYLPNYGPFDGQAHNDPPQLGVPGRLILPDETGPKPRPMKNPPY